MICWGSSWKQLTACLFQKHKASRQNLDFNIKLTTHIKVKGFIIFCKYKKLSDFFQWYLEAMVFWGYGILRLWYSEAVVFWGCFTDNKYCPLWIFDSYHNMEGQFCRFWKKQYWYLEIWHHPLPPTHTPKSKTSSSDYTVLDRSKHWFCSRTVTYLEFMTSENGHQP